MKIGIHSDLHTEFSLCKISNLHELDLLILAGDIGDLQTVDILFEQIRLEMQKITHFICTGKPRILWHVLPRG